MKDKKIAICVSELEVLLLLMKAELSADKATYLTVKVKLQHVLARHVFLRSVYWSKVNLLNGVEVGEVRPKNKRRRIANARPDDPNLL